MIYRHNLLQYMVIPVT